METAASGINWDTVVKIIGAVTPAVGWIAGQIGLRMGRRASLKADLEILEKIKNDEHKRLIEQKIEATVRKLYGVSEFGNLVTGMTLYAVIVGALWTLGFAYWTMTILFDDDWNFAWSWWALLTGYIALIPISMLSLLTSEKAAGRNKIRNGDPAEAETAERQQTA